MDDSIMILPMITEHEGRPVTTSRLDSKALKAADPELWQRFSQQTTARRFIIA